MGLTAGLGAKGLIWIAATAVAVLLPVAVYFGAEAYVERELQAHLQRTAVLVVQRVENAIDRSVVTLKEAALRRANSCNLRDREALRVLAFGSPVLKEVAVLAPDGAVLCNNIGELVRISPLSDLLPTRDPRISLGSVVAFGSEGRALRVVWREHERAIFGGLVAAGLFAPFQEVNGQGDRLGIEVNLSEGSALLISRNEGRNGPFDARLDSVSPRFPVKIAITASRADWRQARLWIIGLATAAAAVLGLVVGALIVIAARRDADPMAEMQDALDNGEFIPHYQPILDIDTGRILGCEVLVRWRKPDGSIVSPGAFIDQAERSGFIFPLTLALMRQAAQELGPTYSARPKLKCGFNLCAAHFKHDGIITDVATIFGASAIQLSQVLLEVTERDPLDDIDTARAIIARFQGMGVKVALDDVGTGHGGMSYLLKLGVDVMKIDKLFIDALGAERQSTAIVDSLIDLAAHLNMDVVAEGVETFAQVEALRRRGVRSAQGYVFAPPLPGSSFIQLVEAMEPATTSEPPKRMTLRG
ncbi:EAL domain-containing protein [Phreatobacter stygius]|uniref:cyclic-guanylate-specific phosphodiesterase n=1 Tax=Phreatobacter stygius TaxID=1940610 RepID=A0A4D7B530_9HYPH|nr:EAL domain-containing protein [Phreatobacter stygius]QCI68081.1 EAL domain-containing protein [Phreatobacter stygius]